MSAEDLGVFNKNHCVEGGTVISNELLSYAQVTTKTSCQCNTRGKTVKVFHHTHQRATLWELNKGRLFSADIRRLNIRRAVEEQTSTSSVQTNSRRVQTHKRENGDKQLK